MSLSEDNVCVPFVVITIQFLPHSKVFTRIVKRATRCVAKKSISQSARKLMKPTKERFDDAKEEKEAVTRRRAGNIMAKIIRKKEQTTIYKTTHKTKDRVKRTPLKSGIKLSAPEETAVPLMVTTMTWLTATECLDQKIMFVFRLS
jgi:hypothetical protein